MKKTIFLIPLLFSAFSQAQDIDEQFCYIKGKVILPKAALDETTVNVYDKSYKIDENGRYCIADKIKNRDQYYLYLVQNKKTILKNIFFDKNKKTNTYNITLNKAMAELSCEDRLCNEMEIKDLNDNKHIKEYSDKLISRYYTSISPNFSYEKIEKKMIKQRRNIEHSNDREIKEVKKNSYFKLDGRLKSQSYKDFEYKKNDIYNNKDKFIKDQTVLKGLDEKSSNADVLITHWLRYAYYYGNDIKFAGALYSEEFKEKNDFKKIEETLRFSSLYQNKAKNSSNIRSAVDEMSFKRTLDKVEGLFLVNGKHLTNQLPDYVDIQFVFEHGSWRLDMFSVNPEYYRYVNDKK